MGWACAYRHRLAGPPFMARARRFDLPVKIVSNSMAEIMVGLAMYKNQFLLKRDFP
jgi:hypothetical protein